MTRRTASAVLAWLLTGAYAQAADLEHGKTLHEANCVKCHGTEVYTRADRRIHSLEALEAQVRRCRNSLGATWSEDHIADLVHYLNHSFYHFRGEGEP
ncbi:MAG: cytochrome c [Gammaproteobacteria bacterium]|nr:cytochrome c [Gammaproteobacteria bacterium]